MSQLSLSNGDLPTKKSDIRDASTWTRLKRIKGTGSLASVLENKTDITNPPASVPNAVINGQRITEFGTSRIRRPTSTWTNYKAFSASYIAPVAVTLNSMTSNIGRLVTANPPPLPVISPETPSSFFGQLESILASLTTPNTVLVSIYNSVSEYYSRAPFSFTGSIYAFTSNTVTNDQMQLLPAGAGILIPQFTALTIGDSTYQVENVAGGRLIKTSIIGGVVTYFPRNSSVTTTGLTPNATFQYLGSGSSGLATMTTGTQLSITASWNSQTSSVIYTLSPLVPANTYYTSLGISGSYASQPYRREFPLNESSGSLVIEYLFDLRSLLIYDVPVSFNITGYLIGTSMNISSNSFDIILRRPVFITVSNITKTAVTLSWEPVISTIPGDNLIGYGIWDVGVFPRRLITSLSPNTTTYTITGLSPATQYLYLARAEYQSGYGAISNDSRSFASFTTTFDMPSIVATYNSATRGLSWVTTNPIPSIPYYNIVEETTNYILLEEVTSPVTITETMPDFLGTEPISVNMNVVLNVFGTIFKSNTFVVFFGPQVSGIEYSNITNTSVTLSWAYPTNSVTDYIIYKNGVQIATTTETSYNITSLSAGTDYTFSVKARYPQGNGQISDDITFTTTGTPPLPSQYVLASYDYVTRLMTWVVVGVPGVTTNNPDADIVDSRNESVILNNDDPGNPYLVTRFLGGTTYSYYPARVIFRPSASVKLRSNIIDLFASVRLTGLTANTTLTSVALTWTALSGATSYVIYNDGIEIGTTTGTTYTATSLAFGTNFYFIVKSIFPTGDGPVAGIRIATLAPTIVATYDEASNQLSWVTTNLPSGITSPLTYYVRRENYTGNFIDQAYTTSPVTIQDTFPLLPTLTTYRREVVYLALVTGGLAKSNSITLVFNNKVTGLVVSNITSTSAILDWTELTSGGANGGYRVFNNGSLVRSVYPTSTSITGLSPNTTYTVEVQPIRVIPRGPTYYGRKTPATFTTSP